MAELTAKAGSIWVQGPLSSTCLPLGAHFLKQSSIFIHPRKGGNYAWPTASLTPPLSQLNGKNRAVQAHPAAGTSALLYVCPNLSCHGWSGTFASNRLTAHTDSSSPLETRAGWQEEGFKPHLQETLGSFRSPHEFSDEDTPPPETVFTELLKSPSQSRKNPKNSEFLLWLTPNCTF